MTRTGRLGGCRIAICAAVALLIGAEFGQASAAGPQIVVAIDAGHGGIDPGASSGGLVEKDVVLGFALRLARQIDATEGFRALLIRSDDTFLTLGERIQRARDGGANLILSLHADTTSGGEAEGAHVYTLSEEGSDEAAEALALRENRAEIIGGVALQGESDDLALLLVDLAQRGTGNEAQKLARAALSEMDGAVTLLPTEPHRQANFRILKAPEIPSILVELGYLSNASDRARLVSEDWQARMASALARGLRRWANSASPGFLTPKR